MALNTGTRGHIKWEDFLREIAHLALARVFSQPSSDMAMEFSPLVTKIHIAYIKVWINFTVRLAPSQPTHNIE